jgi:seryl-tRNA synthetase
MERTAMHDIKAIRDDRAGFVAGLARRASSIDGKTPDEIAEAVLSLDHDLREVQTRLQSAQSRRNEASKLIGAAKAKKDEAQASALMAEVAGLKNEIQEGEEKERTLQKSLSDALAVLPNIPASDVPVGASEEHNVEVAARAFGARPAMNSAKEHFELGEALGLMDFERAAKVSGARFVYLKGALAKLERALGSFMLDLHTEKFGYTEVQPPLMVRDEAMFGTGQLPKFEEDLFVSRIRRNDGKLGVRAAERFMIDLFRQYEPQVELFQQFYQTWAELGDREAALRRNPAFRDAVDLLTTRQEEFVVDELKFQLGNKEYFENLYFIPTAEVPLTNYVREEILDEASLPLRFTAYTPCFRAEAGAAGKDTRGMIRMHQFSKVELVSIVAPEQSDAEHERMTDCAQEVLKRLGLHHRVMTLCTGDMGFTAKKTYDIEVWLPGQNRFREISSCSNCGDFQARRMNTRYRPKGAKATRFVHTLNGSGLAVGRTLVAILENYQQADGSILIPEALRSYMGGMERIAK